MSSISELIQQETERQNWQLSLIASENYVSKAVLSATGSRLTNKYAEGYPGKRYYAGNQIVDEVETRVQFLAQKLFATDYHVNVQPYSGSPANLAAYSAVLSPGDPVLAMSLAHGGHLTHGHSVSFTGKLYTFHHYGVNRETELIDYDQVADLAREHQPKLIVCGATAYPMQLDFARFAEIARQVQALLMVDMAHIAGLVAARVHQSPFGHADIITTSTHKTLRGPRAGLIFCKPELQSVIDRAVFPGLQGGPHMNTIAAIGIALEEALQPEFHRYAEQILKNSQALAFALSQGGLRIVAGGTENHLLLVDLSNLALRGREAMQRLESVGLITNMNAIPYDPYPPTDPSGLRLGAAALTTRGMRETELNRVAELLLACLHRAQSATDLTAQVNTIAKRFPIP